MESETHAVFWPDPGVLIPLDLATLPGIPDGSQPKAYRINNLTDIDVVGRFSDISGVALLWECSANCDDLMNWSVVDLNEELTPDCKSAGNWTLYRADDVNDNGMIIGSGHRQGQGPHAFILEPLEPCCPWDLNGDGQLSRHDMAILLAALGPCPQCAACPADFNCDDVVDQLDQAILVAKLSELDPCPGVGSSASAAEQAAQEMGFADAQALSAWLIEATYGEALAAGYLFAALLHQYEGE